MKWSILYTNYAAFAVILGNGRMVKWGDSLPTRVIQLPLGRTVIAAVCN